MLAVLVLISAIAAEPDPCAPTEPDADPDPIAAAHYLGFGLAERDAGREETAVIALRRAAELDPDDPRARAALDELCVPATATTAAARDRIAEANDIMELSRSVESGECDGALARIESFAELREEPIVSLLEGLCLLDRGEHASARAALLRARAGKDARASAELLLAVLAYREADADAALAFVGDDDVSAAPDVAAARAAIRKLVRRGGRDLVSMSVAVDALLDSNPSLAPAELSSEEDLAGIDGAFRAGGTIALSPVRSRFFDAELGARAAYQRQLQLRELDRAGAGGFAGIRVGGDEIAATAAYALDYEALDGTPHVLEHQAALACSGFSGRWRFEASYALVYRSVLEETAKGYSGLAHAPALALDVLATSGLWVGIGYQFVRDAVDDPALRSFAHGPTAHVVWSPSEMFRVSFEAAFSTRSFDGASGRSDMELDTRAVGELDIDDRWSLIFATAVVRNSSSAAEETYTRALTSAGIRFAHGLF